MFTYTKYMIEANKLPVEFMTEDLYHSDLVDNLSLIPHLTLPTKA